MSNDQLEENRRLREELRRAVHDFVRDQAGPEARRAAMASDEGYAVGLVRRAAAELGLTGVAVPEPLGGVGMGVLEALDVVGELGRYLVVAPFTDALVVTGWAAGLGRDGGADDPLARLQTAVAEGASVALGGLTPGPRGYDGITATRLPGGRARLDGTAHAVAFGTVAEQHVLVVGEPGAHIVVLAPAGAAGLRVAAAPSLDPTRPLAHVHLDGVEADIVADGAEADRLVALARVALAAECAAAADQILDQTVDYLRVRHQFGRPIGSFQALKHRAADLALRCAEARASAAYAAEVLAGVADVDPEHPGSDPALLSALVKTVCSDALFDVAADCLQLHGGIGFTAEHDVHLYLKRGKSSQHLLGTNSSLRDGIGRRLGL